MLTPNPVQTTYARYLPVAQNGMPATTTGWDIDTRLTEDPAGTGIGFGLAVSQGTKKGDRSACLGLLSGKSFVGITVADPTLGNLVDVSGQFTDKYADGENMAVLHRGDIWVLVVGNVAAGADVYFDSSTGQFGPSTISNATAILGARFLTSVPAETQLPSMAVETGQLAIVRLVGVATL